MARHDEALAAYDQALAAAPDNVEALNKSPAACSAGPAPSRRGAGGPTTRRCGWRPNSPPAFNNRGSALLDLKRFADALSCFDRALALRPGNAQVLNNRRATHCRA